MGSTRKGTLVAGLVALFLVAPCEWPRRYVLDLIAIILTRFKDPKRPLRFDVYLFGARTFVQGRGKFSFKPWRGDQHAALVNSQHRSLQNTRLGCREIAIAEAEDFYTHMNEATTGQIDKILQQVPAEDAVPSLSKCASPPKQSRMLSQLMAAWNTEDIAPAAVSLKSQRGQRMN
ncbi:hypothetical protein Ae201684P_008203 [Aphanomyces euteiches]|nr:hypothetical protein Ae201684P_008203 [Aphanomyces euteiches]